MDKELPIHCPECRPYTSDKRDKVLMVPMNILYGKGVMCPICYKKVIIKEKIDGSK